jgi:hypothetical protein
MRVIPKAGQSMRQPGELPRARQTTPECLESYRQQKKESLLKNRRPADSKPIEHYGVPIGAAHKYSDGWHFIPLVSGKYYRRVKHLRGAYPEFYYLDVMLEGCLYETEEVAQAMQEMKEMLEQEKAELGEE